MTGNEILAFNRGVAAVLAIAARTAQSIRSAPHYRPTRDEFAAEALAALAAEGRALLIGEPGGDLVAADRPTPDRPDSGGNVVALAPAAAE